jgi:hypothetical protein
LALARQERRHDHPATVPLLHSYREAGTMAATSGRLCQFDLAIADRGA